MNTKALRLFKLPLKKDLPPVPIPEKEVDKFAEKKFRKINEKKVFYTDNTAFVIGNGNDEDHKSNKDNNTDHTKKKY